MKFLKTLLLVVTILSLLLLTACDLGGIINNTHQGDNNNSQSTQTNLQLLRIETAESAFGTFPNGYTALSINQQSVPSFAAQNTDVQVEEIENSYVNLVAVIKK